MLPAHADSCQSSSAKTCRCLPATFLQAGKRCHEWLLCSPREFCGRARLQRFRLREGRKLLEVPVRFFEFDDSGFVIPGRGEASEYLHGRGERFSFAATATEYLQGRGERLCFSRSVDPKKCRVPTGKRRKHFFRLASVLLRALACRCVRLLRS